MSLPQNNVCSGYGCTDPNAYNYSNLAIVNDGSCCYVAGCTDACLLIMIHLLVLMTEVV